MMHVLKEVWFCVCVCCVRCSVCTVWSYVQRVSLYVVTWLSRRLSSLWHRFPPELAFVQYTESCTVCAPHSQGLVFSFLASLHPPAAAIRVLPQAEWFPISFFLQIVDYFLVFSLKQHDFLFCWLGLGSDISYWNARQHDMFESVAAAAVEPSWLPPPPITYWINQMPVTMNVKGSPTLFYLTISTGCISSRPCSLHVCQQRPLFPLQ